MRHRLVISSFQDCPDCAVFLPGLPVTFLSFSLDSHLLLDVIIEFDSNMQMFLTNSSQVDVL